jgi:N-acetylglutamate synthase-like GNAT family acetyltransferase
MIWPSKGWSEQLTAMPHATLAYAPLPRSLTPLLARFYRRHGSRMRAESQAQLWVARDPEIVAALCLSPVAQGQWLTGLLVAPETRGNGVGATLVEQALICSHGPTWLFCQPALERYYRRLGFAPCTGLPESLAARLARYHRSKALLAMVSPPAD